MNQVLTDGVNLPTAKLRNRKDYQDVLLPNDIRFDVDEVWLYKDGNAVVLLPKVAGASFQDALANSLFKKGIASE